ncbi:uncharacterized protein NPIL_288241 [Nephila pilipes]|uniref:Uncharacterized protein n=1 Tax=Nephila pilipes TaxID=299642 RepID=A0A8X6UMN5_NEPPI|nr:uncharacterized protein NPIL_288241 [Nephila pilipes]
MNIFPKEAPVYGGGRIILELYNEVRSENVSYYLVFQGSQLRHTINSISNWNNGFLQLSAVIPKFSYGFKFVRGSSARWLKDLSITAGGVPLESGFEFRSH